MSIHESVVSSLAASPAFTSGIPAQLGREKRLDFPPESPTVLVADPVGALSAAVESALAEHAGCRLMFARSADEVDDLVMRGARGEVAMVSVRFSGDTSRIIRTLRTAGWAHIVVLTAGTEIAPVVEAVQAGAGGVVRVAYAEPNPHQPVPTLSARELQIVRLVADGRSNKAIGVQLSLSPLTVKNHLARAGKKFGTGDRAHIVAIAYRGGLLPGPADPEDELHFQLTSHQ